MKISLIAASELDATLIQRWRQISALNSAAGSPYYCPEFAQMVAASGQSVRIAVLEDGGGIQGFFPHEKGSWGRILPVGQGLNDYHGPVLMPDIAGLDVSALLHACGGSYYAFNHMPMTQLAFAPYVRFAHASPVMDLAGGWDAYVRRLAQAQNKATPGVLAAIRYSTKRIEKEAGPLRFEFNAVDPAVLQVVMRLKSAQRARTVGSKDDPFAQRWVQTLFPMMLAQRTTAFGGALCALYAGDSLVACHFGLRAAGVLHYWFPVYEPDFAMYQPGLIMLKLLAEQGNAEGVDLIDLGRGTQDYKMRFCTGKVALGEGAVSRPMALAQARMAALQWKAKLKADARVARLWQQLRKRNVTP